VTFTLVEGSEAIAQAAILADCRFFAAYPMSPFTELLEEFAARLPESGGVCINAESEIEGINMAIGAAAAGFRAATGSCGQGLALMQEAISEVAINETPLVIFNIARNQQDYFQATRGGGWGDTRTIALAPKSIPEAVEHTQLAFHLADKHRAPVIVVGDNLIASTRVAVSLEKASYEPLPPKTWALDGTLGGTGRSRQIWTWALGKANTPGPGPDQHWRDVAAKFDAIGQVEARWDAGLIPGADYVVAAWGTGGLFVEHVVTELRAEGIPVGYFRPVTLWPFPEAALEAATEHAKAVLVFELNAGQMLDDVRIHAPDRSAVRFIGSVSQDQTGMRQGDLLDAAVVRDRVLTALKEGS
jgi:2-oxoglutarate/2-oxoacid ferredoxin oxidoreductase subunit alpha